MRRQHTRATSAGAFLLLLAGLTVALATPAAAAGPRPAFQLPFPCGQLWRLDTWSHAPALDMVREPDQTGTDGALLIAPASGRVVQSFYHENAGNMVQIDHGGDWFTTYIHLQSRAVAVGATVQQGTTIGRVGATGPTSNGHPHLHFELAIDTNGDGRASWGTSNSERVRPWFNGVEYGQSNGQTWRNVKSNNCGGSTGSKTGSDVNVDGKDDILSVYNDGTLAYYPNNSSSSSVHFLSARAIGNAPAFRLMAMGDVNVDGRKDMLSVYNDGTLAYYPNNSSSSGVHFLSARSIGNAPGFKMMTMGDVNVDGKEDILAVYNDGTLVYYPNNSSSSGVHFLAAREIGNAPAFRLLAMGDVNVDGKDDMLSVYADGTLAYYPNNSSSSGVHFLSARAIGNAPAFRLMEF